MKVATVSSKGQITIPQIVRERMKVVPGSRIEFAENARGVFECIPLTGSVKDLAGAVVREGPPMTLAQMEDGIASEMAANDARSRE